MPKYSQKKKGRLKTEFQTTFVFLRPALERFHQRQTDFVLLVAVQPVGIAVDAAVFVAEDGLEDFQPCFYAQWISEGIRG